MWNYNTTPAKSNDAGVLVRELPSVGRMAIRNAFVEEDAMHTSHTLAKLSVSIYLFVLVETFEGGAWGSCRLHRSGFREMSSRTWQMNRQAAYFGASGIIIIIVGCCILRERSSAPRQFKCGRGVDQGEPQLKSTSQKIHVRDGTQPREPCAPIPSMLLLESVVNSAQERNSEQSNGNSIGAP